MTGVVLAGGGGLRLWPLSRTGLPKQFLRLTSNNTMFFETISRNKQFCDEFVVTTNLEYKFLCENDLEGLDVKYKLILESIGRNTAPAIAINAMLAPVDEILYIIPADAKITNDDRYISAILEAKGLATAGNIVTFGIKPTYAHTGYGYIEHKHNSVLSFKEKPDEKTAIEYITQGGFLWNSGMFMFKAGVFLSELQKYNKEIYDTCRNLVDNLKMDKPDIALQKEYMEKIPAISVDYAVMEHSKLLKVVESNFEWDDIGGLEAVADLDKNPKNTILNNTNNVSVINDTAERLIVVNDVENLIITDTNDAIYISKKGCSSDIKDIISQNRSNYTEFFDENIKTYRPWGCYEVLIHSVGYKVKRITVNPGKRLSLQKHNHRTEHWTVVSGTATITLGDITKDFTANESAYIGLEMNHRLANNTNIPVQIIEVAVGNVISEDDIIRIEDDYLRE